MRCECGSRRVVDVGRAWKQCERCGRKWRRGLLDGGNYRSWQEHGWRIALGMELLLAGIALAVLLGLWR